MAEKRFLSGAAEVQVSPDAVIPLTTRYDKTTRQSSDSVGRVGRAVDKVSHHLVVGFADTARTGELLGAAASGELVVYRKNRFRSDRAKRYSYIGLSEWDTLMHSTRKTVLHPIFALRSFPLTGREVSNDRLFAVKAGDLAQSQKEPPRRIRVMSETRPQRVRNLLRAA